MNLFIPPLWIVFKILSQGTALKSGFQRFATGQLTDSLRHSEYIFGPAYDLVALCTV